MKPEELPWELEAPSAGKRTLSLRWLGTAGYELVCEGTTLLIDPYLSRVSLPQFLFRRLRPNRAAIEAGIDDATGIVVGHSHFDHLMDVPAIATLTGARVWGSRSTANLLRASGVPEGQIVECVGGEAFEVGPFRVRLVPSQHSRFGLRKTVPFAGEIPCSCDIPMRGRDYRCGDVFGVSIRVGDLTLYHVGSANLTDDEITDRDVDVVLLCIAARHATERYIPRILQRLTPRWVVPTHYDNFFRGAQRPLKVLPKTAFGEFVDEVQAFDRQIDIGTLTIGGSATLQVG